MKAKVNEWGNSHGIRITGPMLDHLNVVSGDEVDIKLTVKGIELKKKPHYLEYVKTIALETIEGMLATTEPVKKVDDPYAESNIGYLVITIDPCKPILREVPKETPGAYRTLVDAKEAARQVLQNAITEAKTSLTTLRQIGVENIKYISI